MNQIISGAILGVLVLGCAIEIIVFVNRDKIDFVFRISSFLR
jgi:hypothetical protein